MPSFLHETCLLRIFFYFYFSFSVYQHILSLSNVDRFLPNSDNRGVFRDGVIIYFISESDYAIVHSPAQNSCLLLLNILFAIKKNRD